MLRRSAFSFFACAFVALAPARPIAQENIIRLSAFNSLDRFGAALAPVGEIGGSPGLLVGSPGGDAVEVRRIADGFFLTGFGSFGNVQFGYAVDAGPQAFLGGAERPLFLVGAPDLFSNPNESEFVALYSELGEHLRVFPPSTADEPTTLFGFSVAFIGDLDGDGYIDFAVGAPGESRGGGSRRWGSVRVFSGDPGSPAPAELLFHRESGLFGMAVDALGDVDGDGRPDLLAASPDSGTTYVLRTKPSSVPGKYVAEVLRRISGVPLPGRIAPCYAAAAGDLDGDQITDVVAQSGPSSVRVSSSRTGATLLEVKVPESDGVNLIVGDAGDYDGDGVPDIGVGAPLVECSPSSGLEIPECDGALYVFDGRTARLLSYLPGTLDTQGWAFASLGDVDGDGHGDVASGSPFLREDGGFEPEPNAGGGSVTVFTYRKSPNNHLTVLGEQKDSDFGRDVSGGQDVDGDGLADFAVSAPKDDAVGTDAGRVQIFKGTTGRELTDLQGCAPGDYFGFSIALVGDLDGDGAGDLLVGAPGADDLGKQDCGCVYAFSGATGVQLYRLYGESASSRLGVSLARAGDLDGDLIEDWIAGAPGCFHPRPMEACDVVGGYACVCSGADGALIRILRGEEAEEFGRYVDGGGFLDGDAVPDLLVSAPRDRFLEPLKQAQISLFGGAATPERETLIGAVFAYSGATGQVLNVLRGSSAGIGDEGDVSGTEQYGVNASFVGDYDGDGRDDVVVSAHEQEGENDAEVFGRFWIHSHAGSGVLVDSGTTLYPYLAFAGFGYAVAPVGDVDQDGTEDVLFCNPASGSRDVVGVVALKGQGNPEMPQVEGFTDWDYYGYSLTGAGDLDGDGVGDMLVGSPTDPDNGLNFNVKAGWNRVMVLLGPNGAHPRSRH